MLKLGSLFDGIGGFMLAGQEAGAVPTFASEIDPAAIRIARKNFPEVLHLGDVAQLRGSSCPEVDLVTMGSPCQDLSIANTQRQGMQGQKSSLFFEAMRLLKEMRERSANVYPRFIVWENVPGAFSSGGGEDFRTVCQSFLDLGGEEKVDLPLPARGWRSAGVLLGRRCSLAWRVLDAQFWGVPQSRRRIYLVCDLDGRAAHRILFPLREDMEEPLVLCPSGDSRVCGAVVGTLPLRDLFVSFSQYRKAVQIGSVSGCLMRKAASNVDNGIWRIEKKAGSYRLRECSLAEYAALQGFTEEYLHVPPLLHPSPEDMEFWRRVFGQDSEIRGIARKSDLYIQKFLKTTISKRKKIGMLGNGIALPCARFVVRRIVDFYEREKERGKT